MYFVANQNVKYKSINQRSKIYDRSCFENLKLLNLDQKSIRYILSYLYVFENFHAILLHLRFTDFFQIYEKTSRNSFNHEFEIIICPVTGN